jgi:tetratricopeptide (TPR) repeat protein
MGAVKLKAAFTSLVQQLIAKQGIDAMFDAAKCKAFLARNSTGAGGPEHQLLLQVVESGVAAAIVGTADPASCKQNQAQLLQSRYNIAPKVANGVIDILAPILRGVSIQETVNPQQYVPSQSAPQPGPANNPAKGLGIKPKHVVIAAAAVMVLFIGIVFYASPGKTADELLQDGNVSFDNGDYKRAVDYYGQAIKKQPSGLAYYNRALAYYNLENYQAAIRDFGQVIGYDKNYYNAYYWRGAAYTGIQNYDAAINDFVYYINSNQNDKSAFVSLGMIYTYVEKYESAISAYSSAIAIDQNYMEAYGLRGKLYLNAGKYNTAIQDFNKVLEIDPSNYDAITCLAAAKEAQDAESQAMVDSVISDLFAGGDLYDSLYNFGYQLGLKAFLDE